MKQSKEFLDIDVTPVNNGAITEYQINYQVCSGEQSGETWSQIQEALPKAENSSKNLWAKLEHAPDDPGQFNEILKWAGLSLYQWLFDRRADEFLKRADVEACQQYLRICLELPAELAEFPWEAARSEQDLSRHFTVIRRMKKPGNQNSNGDSLPLPLRVKVIGVDYKEVSGYKALKTAHEAALVNNHANKLDFCEVELDVQGTWSNFKKKCEDEQFGPPTIFHFAGHSAQDGSALLFRNDQGEVEEIDAERLASVLTVNSPATTLAFLNACTTSARSKRFYLPYHSLAETLIGQGVSMVLGVQTPLLDKDAGRIAGYFYEEFSQGASFDCALQEARSRLWRDSQKHCNWPFIFGMVAHRPYSLHDLVNRNSSTKLHVTDFGFAQQSQALEALLTRESPTLIIIPGEEGSGHSHVMKKAERKLKEKDRSHWDPIPKLYFDTNKTGALFEREFLARFAESIGLDNNGDDNAIRSRIIDSLESELQHFDVIVFQFEEPLSLLRGETPEQNHILQICAVLETILIQLKEGEKFEKPLSFFFLLPIEYPKSDEEPELAQKGKRFIEQLKKSSEQTLRTRVVKELQRLGDSEIEEFLENSFDYSSDEVAHHLERLRKKDNEKIVKHISNLIKYSNG